MYRKALQSLEEKFGSSRVTNDPVRNTVNMAKAEAVRDLIAELDSLKRRTSGVYRSLEEGRGVKGE